MTAASILTKSRGTSFASIGACRRIDEGVVDEVEEDAPELCQNVDSDKLFADLVQKA